jgi:hypothetical protein
MAGVSLARWDAVSGQFAPRVAKYALTGPPPVSARGGISHAWAQAADGSLGGSLDGSGATTAPRGCAGCTVRALAAPRSGSEVQRLHLVSGVIHSPHGVR